jgi:hypothetical protein
VAHVATRVACTAALSERVVELVTLTLTLTLTILYIVTQVRVRADTVHRAQPKPIKRSVLMFRRCTTIRTAHGWSGACGGLRSGVPRLWVLSIVTRVDLTQVIFAIVKPRGALKLMFAAYPQPWCECERSASR